jgi:hypothetical protein
MITRLTCAVGMTAGNDPIDPLAICLLGLKPQPEFLAHHGGQEATHGVRLTADGMHDRRNGGTARPRGRPSTCACLEFARN